MKLALVTLVSFLATFILVPLVRRLAMRLKIFDPPEKRKLHSYHVPRLGGLAIAGGFLISSGLAFYLGLIDISSKEVILFTLASAVMVTTGLLDDIRGFGAPIKLALQFIAVSIFVFSGLKIQSITIFQGYTIELGLLSVPLSVFWLLFIINAINLIDGLDGLSSSMAITSLVFFGLLAFVFGHNTATLASLLLIAALVAFLFFNIHPAKIFMGDTGSLFLGMWLAVLSIKGTSYSGISLPLFVPVLILAIPALDVFLAIARRAIRCFRSCQKDQLKIHRLLLSSLVACLSADNFHIHHQLLRRGFRPTPVVGMMALLATFFGLLSIVFLFETLLWQAIILSLSLISVATFTAYLNYPEFKFGQGKVEELDEELNYDNLPHLVSAYKRK